MVEDAKKRAVELYESCIFDRLLGDTLRPGGLALTGRLAQVVGVTAENRILDIACGKGTTAFFLAGEYHCQVTGIDMSSQMISFCMDKAARQQKDRVTFLLGDAENLPFHEDSFDTVISECSFSLLPDKKRAARGFWRVLKPGGKLVITDFIVRGEADSAMRSQISSVCCLAGACKLEEYINILERAGFESPYIEDRSNDLRKVAFQLGMTFGSMDKFLRVMPAGPCERKKAQTTDVPSGRSYQEFVKTARPTYVLLAMNK